MLGISFCIIGHNLTGILSLVGSTVCLTRPWRYDHNLIVPVLKERNKGQQVPASPGCGP